MKSSISGLEQLVSGSGRRRREALEEIQESVQKTALSNPGSVIQAIRDMETLMNQEGFRDTFSQIMLSSPKRESSALGNMIADPMNRDVPLTTLMRQAGVRLCDVMLEAIEAMRSVVAVTSVFEVARRAPEIIAATVGFAVEEKSAHQDRKVLMGIIGLQEKTPVASININNGVQPDLSDHGSFESIAKAGSTILLQN